MATNRTLTYNVGGYCGAAHSEPLGNSKASNESGFIVALYPGFVGGM